MNDTDFKDYPDVTHIPKEQLDPNSSIYKMLTLIGGNKSVIDFGCATGHLAKLLSDDGCTVVGVDINPVAVETAARYCDRAIVADLDYKRPDVLFENEKFDAVIFGDVLEHLKDPWGVLKSARNLLTPEGCVVASIPNIAHGAIRLALLSGKFEYSKLGILDDTHLRFFTRDTVYRLFEQAGLDIETEETTWLPVFNESALIPALAEEDYSEELKEFIYRDKYSDVLQFVVRAYPHSASQARTKLREQLEASQTNAEKLFADIEGLQAQLRQTSADLQLSRDELQEVQTHWHHTKAELQAVQGELQQAQADLRETQAELQQTQVDRDALKTELQQTQAESAQLAQQLRAIESSKFLKARNAWLKLKRATGLTRS